MTSLVRAVGVHLITRVSALSGIKTTAELPRSFSSKPYPPPPSRDEKFQGRREANLMTDWKSKGIKGINKIANYQYYL